MKPFFQKLGKFKKPYLTTTDAPGSIPESTSTSTIMTSTASDPVPSVPANARAQVILSADITIAHEFQVSASERNPIPQHSGLGLFSNARNLLIIGGTFNNVVNVLPANTGECQAQNTPVRQKPISSLERKDVLPRRASTL